VSNRERDPDARFNYDLFVVNARTGQERRLSQTPGVEIGPVWSPDGESIAYTATRREMTTIDSVAEDTHLWLTDRTGGKHHEVSASLDRRVTSPHWSNDGQSLFFLAGDHGKQLIFRVRRDGSQVSTLFDQAVQIGSLTMAASQLAFTITRATVPTEIGTLGDQGGEVRPLTRINEEFTREWDLGQPETLRYWSFDATPVEGWLLRPSGFERQKRFPCILSIHGGPHGMFGYGFNFAHQLFASQGYAVLYLNPRGSSGYGQKFSDGCVGNWGGSDYRDLMAGVEHAIAQFPWIDAKRLGVTGGSYGGFMTNWIVTQTPRFRAALPVASLSNLISFYATSLYQDLIHAEFNGFPWDNFDLLWRYSPLRYVKNAETPMLFIHGEADNEVHIMLPRNCTPR
jgi:dipeptidyl aminopeptidase/acylaminoacyl peptidase